MAEAPSSLTPSPFFQAASHVLNKQWAGKNRACPQTPASVLAHVVTHICAVIKAAAPQGDAAGELAAGFDADMQDLETAPGWLPCTGGGKWVPATEPPSETEDGQPVGPSPFAALTPLTAIWMAAMKPVPVVSDATGARALAAETRELFVGCFPFGDTTIYVSVVGRCVFWRTADTPCDEPWTTVPWELPTVHAIVGTVWQLASGLLVVSTSMGSAYILDVQAEEPLRAAVHAIKTHERQPPAPKRLAGAASHATFFVWETSAPAQRLNQLTDVMDKTVSAARKAAKKARAEQRAVHGSDSENGSGSGSDSEGDNESRPPVAQTRRKRQQGGRAGAALAGCGDGALGPEGPRETKRKVASAGAAPTSATDPTMPLIARLLRSETTSNVDAAWKHFSMAVVQDPRVDWVGATVLPPPARDGARPTELCVAWSAPDRHAPGSDADAGFSNIEVGPIMGVWGWDLPSDAPASRVVLHLPGSALYVLEVERGSRAVHLTTMELPEEVAVSAVRCVSTFGTDGLMLGTPSVVYAGAVKGAIHPAPVPVTAIRLCANGTDVIPDDVDEIATNVGGNNFMADAPEGCGPLMGTVTTTVLDGTPLAVPPPPPPPSTIAWTASTTMAMRWFVFSNYNGATINTRFCQRVLGLPPLLSTAVEVVTGHATPDALFCAFSFGHATYIGVLPSDSYCRRTGAAPHGANAVLPIANVGSLLILPSSSLQLVHVCVRFANTASFAFVSVALTPDTVDFMGTVTNTVRATRVTIVEVEPTSGLRPFHRGSGIANIPGNGLLAVSHAPARLFVLRTTMDTPPPVG